MIQLKKTLLTLAALLAVTTGAWADEQSESFTTATSGQLIYTGEHFTITGQSVDSDGLWIGRSGDISDKTVTIESKNGENITKIEAVLGYVQKWEDSKLATTSGEVTGTYEEGQTITISSVNATTVTLSGPEGENKLIQFKSWTIYYGGAASSASAVDIDWNGETKTGTFKQPAGNVTVSVEYYDQATLAFQGLTAAEDAAAKTEAPLAVVADGAVTGGTLMYYVATDKNFSQADAIALAETAWSADIPTAETVEAAGTCYVWYYIKGDAEHSDTDPVPLAVTLLPEPTYAVTFAEGTDPNEWTADPNTGVTKGQQVTVTYTGSKKVIGVKAEKKAASAGTPLDNTTTAWTAGTYAVPAGGLTYSDAITVSGDVTLTLTDGETLTLNKGISLAEGATLTVEGNGTMNVNGTNGADNNSKDYQASGGSGTAAISGSGTLVLTSGTVTAIGGKGGNVSDYMPECKGGHGAAAISCTLTVNGGTLTATGGKGGNLTNGFGPEGVAGNGGAGISGALTVNGGTLTATGGDRGAKSSGPGAQDGSIGRGISSTWTAGTGITFSDSANGTSWTANTGTSSTQRYVKAE